MSLPASVQEIADVIGRDAALYLISQLPTCLVRTDYKSDKRSHLKSRRVILYVPKKLKPNHMLVQILGLERANKLVEGFAGEILNPANCQGKSPVSREQRDGEIRRLHGEGKTTAELAEIMGLTERRIRTLTKGHAHGAMRAANDDAGGA